MKRVSLWMFCVLAIVANKTLACPFCESADATWLQSMRDAKATAFVTVTRVVEPDKSSPVPLSSVECEIVEIVRANDKLVTKTIRLEMLDAPKVGAKLLLTADGEEELSWSPLCELTPARAEYFAAARKLPEQGIERWQFFYRHLDAADEQVAADAYGEFAWAKFAEVKAFAPHADREQLWRWITSDKTPDARRGLYYTLLGQCGERRDAEKIWEMIVTPDKRPPGMLSPVVACYVSLRGEEGLKQVEERFLKRGDKEKEKTLTPALSQEERENEIEAVIVALRFHGEEQVSVRRERIAQSFRLLLDRPERATSGVADLARWQDWESLPQVVKLYDATTEETAWVRPALVAYLQVCPRDAAKQTLEELRRRDPKALEEASALSLFGAQLRPKR